MHVLRSLGITGGLKGCEKKLGIDRKELDGVDGYFAVLLWREYLKSGNRAALDTLLAYNIEDVVNLETLMVIAYNMNLDATPFSGELRLPLEPDGLVHHEGDLVGLVGLDVAVGRGHGAEERTPVAVIHAHGGIAVGGLPRKSERHALYRNGLMTVTHSYRVPSPRSSL